MTGIRKTDGFIGFLVMTFYQIGKRRDLIVHELCLDVLRLDELQEGFPVGIRYIFIGIVCDGFQINRNLSPTLKPVPSRSSCAR